MAQTVPEAKIVCVFRNPVERVVSLYRLKQAYGLIPWEFEEALERDPELMESSKYVSHLKLWRRSFGSDKILTLLYDDLRRSPQDFVNSLADFVSVPRFKLRRRQCELVHDSDRMTRPRSYYRTRSATLLSDWLKARQMDWMVSAFKRSRLQRFVLGGGPPFPKPSLEALAQLEVRLQPEIEQLETLIQRDLSAWKNRKAA
jgi:hypothetical protein